MDHYIQQALLSKAKYSNSHTHSYKDGGGCIARCRPARQEQFWGSVSCTRTLPRADQGNRTSDLSITRCWLCPPEPQPSRSYGWQRKFQPLLRSCQRNCYTVSWWSCRRYSIFPCRDSGAEHLDDEFSVKLININRLITISQATYNPSAHCHGSSCRYRGSFVRANLIRNIWIFLVWSARLTIGLVKYIFS